MRSAFGLAGALLFSLCLACGREPSASELSTSREARAYLGPAREIPEPLLAAIDPERFARDLPYQREVSWSIWASLFQGPDIAAWRTWYAVEDLQRIFRRLYEGLGKSGRAQRQPFSSQELKAAIRWHDTEQFQAPDWDRNRWERWLEQYSAPDLERSLPGMNKIVMNRAALVYILSHYETLVRCWRERASCQLPPLPESSAFIKTAWRRSGDGFSVPLYQTSELGAQLAAPGWTSEGSTVPEADAAYSMRTLSAQTFHLVGMHFMIKTQERWAWSSLWLGEGSGGDLGADRPESFPYSAYRLCALGSLSDDWRGRDSASWDPSLQSWQSALNAASLPNWCSNPYLELGAGNQKTNCAGCHQHAGLAWNNQEFIKRLKEDLPLLLEAQGPAGPSDQVWSLLAGPSPLAALIADIIDYFDVYDPYNALEEN